MIERTAIMSHGYFRAKRRRRRLIRKVRPIIDPLGLPGIAAIGGCACPDARPPRPTMRAATLQSA
jgi:hypothetical protein